MKNLIILVLSILLFYLQLINCTLIGLGRREEGDKILLKTDFHSKPTLNPDNHTILIKVTNKNPITYIRFFPSTVFTTSSVTYDGSQIKFVEFTAHNITNFHINMTVYGYDQPLEYMKTQSSLYQELLKLDRMVDSKLSSNSYNNNNNNQYNILNVHTNYINDSDSDITSDYNGTDYDESNMDELFSLISTMKLKNFNLSITNDRLIPIYNQYNEKLLLINVSNNSDSDTDAGSMDDIDSSFIQWMSFLLHTKQNYYNFWSHDNATTSSATSFQRIAAATPLSSFNLKYFNCFYLVYSLMCFMILL